MYNSSTMGNRTFIHVNKILTPKNLTKINFFICFAAEPVAN